MLLHTLVRRYLDNLLELLPETLINGEMILRNETMKKVKRMM